MQHMRKPLSSRILRWLQRTPVHTFIMCPLLVVAFELALNRGSLTIMPWGIPLLIWGYLQYLFVGNYRLPRAGGTAGMDAMPQRIIDVGPYRYTRNPMYLGHLIFMVGLVLQDEARLEKVFGGEYASYRARVKRWIPFVL